MHSENFAKNRLHKKTVFLLCVRIVIVVSVALILLISDRKDFSDISLCALYNLTGILCPGCGMTRSFHSIMHLDFVSAFEYNPVFVLLIFPLILFFLFDDIVCLCSYMGNDFSGKIPLLDKLVMAVFEQRK